MCVCVIHSCFQEKASFIRTEKVFVIASFCCSYQTPHPPSPFFSFLIILLSFIIHLFTPEYSARVQSVIPSMTSSQSEHHRSHSLSGWFSHPVWRNTSKKRKKKERKGNPLFFFFFFFCKCCFKPSLYLLCLWLMWALVCIFNHFSCLILDCPHLLILSFYSTSSLLYVSLSSSGLRCIIIKLTTDSFLRTRSHFIYVCSELLSCFLLQG